MIWRPRHMGRYVAFAFCAFLLSGCITVGPDFLRPQSAAQKPSTGFINEIYRKNIKHQSISFWWERIDDPLLNQYIAQLLDDNLQLVQAAERINQAQARQRIAGSDNYPSIAANGGASRSFAENSLTNRRSYTNAYNAELSSSWEIDLFGKIRRTVESADASAMASIYDQEALVHSLISELLSLRVEIATYKELLAYAQKTADNRKGILEIVERRYEIGAQNIKPQSVMRARNSLETAQADIHEYQRLIADAAYRLDVLLGQAPGTIDPMASDIPVLSPPVDVAACLPADLIDRRPDLRASELRAKAANADIGVAVADLYPSLSLGGSLGFSSDTTRNFFSADRLAGSILASIVGRIFEGGSLRANIDLQKSEARELAASYADDVLNAMREVETYFKAEYELGQELEHSLKSVAALQTAEDIVESRYMRGIESLQDFLDAQQELYTAQQGLLQVQQAKWNARIALYLALGGDWFGQDTCSNTGINDNKDENDGEI